MPQVICPSCGYEFRAVRCQCRGQIVSAESWKLGRWDWRPLYGAFSDNVRPMDIDFMVERNNQFLIFETKGMNVEIGNGQRRALEALARIEGFRVATLWGQPDEPEIIEECLDGIWQGKNPITKFELWDYASDWWRVVNQGGRK